MASASDFQSEDKGSIPFTCTIYKLGVIDASCGSYESSGFNFTFDGKYFRQGFTGEIIY